MSIANVGTTDRIIRLTVGAMLVAFPFLSNTTSASATGISCIAIGAVLVITAFINFCPLYSLFRLNTGRKG